MLKISVVRRSQPVRTKFCENNFSQSWHLIVEICALKKIHATVIIPVEWQKIKCGFCQIRFTNTEFLLIYHYIGSIHVFQEKHLLSTEVPYLSVCCINCLQHQGGFPDVCKSRVQRTWTIHSLLATFVLTCYDKNAGWVHYNAFACAFTTVVLH